MSEYVQASRTFSELLLLHRGRAGLSQAGLAERSGLSVRALRDLERGRSSAAQQRSAELLADGLRLDGEERAAFLAAAQRFRRRHWDPAAAGSAAAAGAGAVPDLLPASPDPFVGRAAELELLAALAAAAAGTPGGAVVPITGPPGVGKTALACAAGHALAAHFPDGRLAVALREADGAPVPPGAALDVLLRAVRVPGHRLPEGAGPKADLLRSLLAGRRALVLLDGAAGEAQVRPLLAGTSGCMTLVTSRSALAGLDATRWVCLEPLSTPEAVRLLAATGGGRRTAAAPRAAAELVELCGNLPLAVRKAGDRLRRKPHWPLTVLLSQLRSLPPGRP